MRLDMCPLQSSVVCDTTASPLLQLLLLWFSLLALLATFFVVAYLIVSEDFFELLLRDTHPDPIRAVHHEDYRVHVAVEVEE